MTTPTVTPSKAKTWISLVGGLLTVLVPAAIHISQFLPPPWPGAVGGVIALLTAFGVYHAPYVPSGAVVVVPAVPTPPNDTNSNSLNPWEQ